MSPLRSMFSSINDDYLFQVFVDVLERYTFLPMDVRCLKDRGKILDSYMVEESISDSYSVSIDGILKKIIEKRQYYITNKDDEIDINENSMQQQQSVPLDEPDFKGKLDKVKRRAQLLPNQHLELAHFPQLFQKSILGVPKEFTDSSLGEVYYSIYSIDNEFNDDTPEESRTTNNAFIISEKGVWTFYKPDQFHDRDSFKFSYDELRNAITINNGKGYSNKDCLYIKLTERTEICIAKFFTEHNTEIAANALLDIIDILKD